MPSKADKSKTKPPLLDRVIGYFNPKAGLHRKAARMVASSLGQYQGADVTTLRSDWRVFGGGNDQTPAGYELNNLRERSRHAERNDPVANGIVDTFGHNVIGSGMQPQSQIRAKVLGISEEAADALRDQAEGAWERFSPFASSDNRLTINELQWVALCRMIVDGEVLAIPTWANEPWRPFGRCVELLEVDRLITPMDKPKTESVDIEHGIRFGRRGQPMSYFIRKPKSTSYNEIRAFDRKGRPKIIHLFPTRRPGQRRGIPWFAPVLTKLVDLADFMEASLVISRVAACLGVFITQTNQFGALGAESATAGDTVQELTPGMVARLRPNESINVVEPRQPGDNYDGFVESILRLIGVSVGLPYELLLKDFSETNYSSARAALLEGRRVFTNWRQWFAAKFCQPIWQLVLEEAFLRGQFDAPDFYRLRHEYCRALWIGGSWGWVDPAKEVNSSRMATDYGFSTLASEAATQGRDWKEIIDQRAREEAYIQKKGVKLCRAAAGGPIDDEGDQEKQNNDQ